MEFDLQCVLKYSVKKSAKRELHINSAKPGISSSHPGNINAAWPNHDQEKR
jgi:hypothetical protein